jgi:small nuclear ribonucleoprotein (snRNP)-like protein
MSSNPNPRFPNPIDNLYKALSKPVQVRIKRNRTFSGILKSIDTHMNILLENAVYSFTKDEEGKDPEIIKEEFESIVIRGDNVLFIEYNPN